MRSILIAMLLLITVIVIYQAVAAGETGMNRQVHEAGKAVSDHIRSMSP
ncbi:hypothetical protein [Paenibacillus arenilitoris]|uniref:Uncharacterized protein n=1 Tax=Paenibacillus arenilitoris TaxID=2772299 RepID=A0A927H6U0_9BACL|nr:hypothetical protein [Paenibacillus arenilitoris]MBD2870916.1 hypothetical protein [Paenibacillus arenilitoris]